MGLIDLMGITTKANQASTDEKQDAAFERARVRQGSVDAGQDSALETLEVAVTNQAQWNTEQSVKCGAIEARDTEQETRLTALEERLSSYKTELDSFISKLAAHELRLEQLNGALRLARQLVNTVDGFSTE